MSVASCDRATRNGQGRDTAWTQHGQKHGYGMDTAWTWYEHGTTCCHSVMRDNM